MNAVLLRPIRALTLTFALPLLLLAAWWTASADSTSLFLPPLSRIAEAFGEVWFSDVLRTDVAPSLARLAAGFAIALAIGVGLGYPIGRSAFLRSFTGPVLAFGRALPPPVAIPVLLVAVGIGDTTKLVVIVLGVVWPILLNTVDGVRGVDQVQLDTMSAYRLGRGTRTRLVLRAASPQIFGGARQALGLALILMVVSEMLMSTNGLGFVVIRFQRSFAIPEMWSGVLLLGLLGFLLSAAFVAVERVSLRWHRGLTQREPA